MTTATTNERWSEKELLAQIFALIPDPASRSEGLPITIAREIVAALPKKQRQSMLGYFKYKSHDQHERMNEALAIAKGLR